MKFAGISNKLVGAINTARQSRSGEERRRVTEFWGKRNLYLERAQRIWSSNRFSTIKLNKRTEKRGGEPGE